MPKTKPEDRRYIQNVELRSTESEDGKRKLSGYIVKWDKPSQEIDGYIEYIRKGAFTKTLSESPTIKALWNHDSRLVLGNTASGTLRLSEDDTGLLAEVDLANTTFANDLWEMVKRGDVLGSSFAFWTVKDEWTNHEDKADERTVIETKLSECSFGVTFPAYLDSQVIEARSIAQIKSHGIDVDTLSGILTRSKSNGYEPTDADTKTIEQTIRTLTDAISTQDRSDNDPEPRSDPAHSTIAEHRAELNKLQTRWAK